MKKLFVLISALFLISSVTFAQSEKNVKPQKDVKIESQKKQLKEAEKVEIKKGDIKKVDETKAAEKEGGAEITFKETHHDFGNIPFKGNGTYEFVFVNTGNEPLILSQPKSSCGCTVPEWPKQPILPGQSDVIKVTYKNTNRPGNFNKYVTVFSNAVVNKEVKLYIKGTVEPEPVDNTPLKMEGAASPVKNN